MPTPLETAHGAYTISDDPARLDARAMHADRHMERLVPDIYQRARR